MEADPQVPELRQALMQTKDMLEASRAENLSLQEIVETYKTQYMQKEEDFEEGSRRILDLEMTMREQADQHKSELQHMRHLLDMK